jgi:putative SOS response-associated peptidase YedK
MCGRFTQRYTWSEVLEFMRVFGPARNLQPHYNIAPTMTVDVIRLDRDGKRELVPMRWGLIPAWWPKSLKEIPATFNARAESVADKPMFRDAFRGQRCIIPASGFYEWTGDKGNKQPHLFTAADGSPILAFAGLWDRWRDRTAGEDVLSCTIIVCGANRWMETYHDRMPVILDEKDFDGWLDGSLGADALKCASESALREWLVSKRINRTGEGDDDPTVLEPLMPEETA